MPIAAATAQARRNESKIGEALVRLNRAVQRATIYPPGHPAVASAVQSFVESLNGAFAERPVLMVGVTSDRLFVEGVELDDRRPALTWLTEQLHGRGLASVALEEGVAEPELFRLVEWLARPAPEGGDGGEPPRLAGVGLTRFDYGKARFTDAPSERLHDPARIWQALAASLAAGWHADDEPLPEDPLVLARELSAHVHRNEGVGAAALLARIEATGAHLPHLPAAARTAMRQRLGSFVGGLAPDLRSQLLRVEKDASRQRLEFLAEVLDNLPDTVVMEILADIDHAGGAVPRQLLNLLKKLIGVAARDPISQELAETKLRSFGLPPGLTALSPEGVRSALEEVFDAQGEHENPEAYQERLDGLSGAPPAGSVRYASRHFRDPRVAHEVTAHVSAIVLRLLVAGPELPEAAAHMRQLLAQLPADIEAARFALVYDVSGALLELLARTSGVGDELRALATEYLARLADTSTVTALIRAAEESTGLPGAGVVGLFRAAGTDAACQAFDRLAELPEGDGHERLTQLLFFLEPDALGAAVGRLRSAGSPSLRALFPLLRHPAAPFGTELVLTFIGNRDPRIRLEAYRLLLEGDPSSAQVQRFLVKASADSDEEVVRLAIERAAAAGESLSAKVLARFLEGWLDRRDGVDLGRKAIAALAAVPGPEGRDVLIRLLQSRRLAVGVKAVRQSMALEAGLLSVGDDESIVAVRAFRRSPAGWLSMLLPE